MSRDKQISEIEIMAGEIDRILCEAEMKKPYPPLHPSIVRAKALYNAGYRKYTNVAEEIFAEIEFEIHQLDFDREETRAIAIEGIIAILKKKYESEKDNDTH